MKRRTAAVCTVGNVRIGGDHPVVVQSMTNTDTADTASTVNQAMELAKAGSELVRVHRESRQGGPGGSCDCQDAE